MEILNGMAKHPLFRIKWVRRITKDYETRFIDKKPLASAEQTIAYVNENFRVRSVDFRWSSQYYAKCFVQWNDVEKVGIARVTAPVSVLTAMS